MDKHAKRVAGAARNTEDGWDELVERVGSAQIVLIGEASHGTHEFYRTRAEFTRRLIEEKGFRLVGLEADWPDTLRIHRYVNGRGNSDNAKEALGDFTRFPQWMWRNTVMVDFVEWLRDWNASREDKKAGIFGMDLYSLHSSIESVLDYLEEEDPEAARRARERYSCFEMYGDDPQMYGYAASRSGSDSCEDKAVNQLVELRRKQAEILSRDGELAEDEFFFAEQNARVERRTADARASR